MIPPSVKERLLRLQHENKKLKAAAAGGAGAGGPGGANSPEVMQTMIEDLKEREKSLEGENRSVDFLIREISGHETVYKSSEKPTRRLWSLRASWKRAAVPLQSLESLVPERSSS